MARCFLLTDGVANIGEQDPERISSLAAHLSRRPGIGTSSFGFEADYNKHLLGPTAVGRSWRRTAVRDLWA